VHGDGFPQIQGGRWKYDQDAMMKLVGSTRLGMSTPGKDEGYCGGACNDGTRWLKSGNLHGLNVVVVARERAAAMVAWWLASCVHNEGITRLWLLGYGVHDKCAV